MDAAFKGYLAFVAVWFVGFMTFGWWIAFAGRSHGDAEGMGIFVMSFLSLASIAGSAVWFRELHRK